MYKLFLKRLTDISAAAVILIISFPIIVIIIAVLYFTNKGKVLFFQDRAGKNGQIFKIIKFKTMNDERDSHGNLLPDPERVSKTGRFIRNASLDEIPQLWNVLKGDMSLIGPRPLPVEYLPLYDKTQIRRHEVYPGITGLAQVNGRNAISWQRKFRWDVWYADHLSPCLDIKIFCKTILTVFSSEGIDPEQATAFTGNPGYLKDDFYSGKKNIREINPIHIEDLLSRSPIEIDFETIGENLKGKVILVTGAAGSIGSEIACQLCRFNPGLLLLCDIAETPLHRLGLDLKDIFPDVTFATIISDIRNKNKMEHIFSDYKPHYVYHAAAYKHVPMMENHPDEAILTNVMGSKIVADMAVAYGTECFIMISSDKAVNPGNVMGASKRIAEIYIQALSGHLQKESKGNPLPVRFITTRFGNVLGSNGSVVPLFVEQIKKGGPVTVTDPNIIRYFMTIPEACSLVLEASSLGKGGEIFIFDMGKPVRIKDMAEEMIRLSGYKPYEEIDIRYTGLRPGEKLFEELLYDKETHKPTNNRKIKIVTACKQDIHEVLPLLNQLFEVSRNCNNREVVRIMRQIVPEFKPG
jgi:lipopolysaccharide/colanic/teichoic acid biosynthesis glycosyltransferase/nucleoside-diphosphate-sugar epimerase